MLYNLFENRDFVSVFAVALLAEGVDRNVPDLFCPNHDILSPSSQRAWIEIENSGSGQRTSVVALLAEGVDRNSKEMMPYDQPEVALLAEGVDRNRWGQA